MPPTSTYVHHSFYLKKLLSARKHGNQGAWRCVVGLHSALRQQPSARGSHCHLAAGGRITGVTVTWAEVVDTCVQDAEGEFTDVCTIFRCCWNIETSPVYAFCRGPFLPPSPPSLQLINNRATDTLRSCFLKSLHFSCLFVFLFTATATRVFWCPPSL